MRWRAPWSTSAKSTAATSANAQAARNLATNSIGATGKGVASTGSAVSTNQETMIPLSAVAHFTQGATPLGVNHQGLLVANTISFNLPPNVSLSTAIATIEATMNRIGVPATIRGTFQGTAKAFQDSLSNQPFLILAALVTIYIVLGVLYESYVHPLTILSTLPSAGVGALLALMAFNTEFSIMALIGVILLIGIVKKNAIMMIDFALDAERRRGMSPLDAIREACLLRFRPIMMTTMAAMLGALPLAVGMGEGGELRQPLGIAIVGGLILSQVLTLYSTPVIYLYLDRFRLWSQRLPRWRRGTACARAFTATGRVNDGNCASSSCSANRAHARSKDARAKLGGKLRAASALAALALEPGAVRLHPRIGAAGTQSRCARYLSRGAQGRPRRGRAGAGLVARLPLQRTDLADGSRPDLQSRYRGRDRPDRAGRRPGRRIRRAAAAIADRKCHRRTQTQSSANAISSGQGFGGTTFIPIQISASPQATCSISGARIARRSMPPKRTRPSHATTAKSSR